MIFLANISVEIETFQGLREKIILEWMKVIARKL
jgi:hypothetical protein